jgi:hypothetical protein
MLQISPGSIPLLHADREPAQSSQPMPPARPGAASPRPVFDGVEARRWLAGKGSPDGPSMSRITRGGALVMLDRIEEVARRKHIHLGRAELLDAQAFGVWNVDWLVKVQNLYLAARQGATEDRARCAMVLLDSIGELGNPAHTLGQIGAHRAHVVFGFGPRELDSLFEAGDGDIVSGLLVKAAEDNPDSGLRASCEALGWIEVSEDRRERDPFGGA